MSDRTRRLLRYGERLLRLARRTSMTAGDAAGIAHAAALANRAAGILDYAAQTATPKENDDAEEPHRTESLDRQGPRPGTAVA